MLGIGQAEQATAAVQTAAGEVVDISCNNIINDFKIVQG